ncbi:exonuclease SbcCD subunit D [Pseudorhodobacter aquimaris]|uniref:exonuclease SbcCD subunit D n=1 Tax=Pseudorhodobacter aquimaris TaxID=687412 RepID=UPI00067D7145|nr:exonuclease SbcCD subunit D [Pseudorhodobacter aquimaris]
MRILHTADWHIGQTLNGFDREAEHRAFLDALAEVIVTEEVDALLVAGDVFDGINPSGQAQRLLYAAIADFLRRRPGLTIVMIAGNHDPAARLEAPEAVLRALGVHVLGSLHRDGAAVDMDRHLIPLTDANDTPRAHVLAIPYLRLGDLPGYAVGMQGDGESAVVTAVRALHAGMVAQALPRTGGLPLLAMGHLTCAGGLESEGAERRILIGGDHAVPPEIYPSGLDYVALGHLHRAQNLDGGRVRYSGSPFPLSASEIAYDHGVTLVDLDAGPPHRHIPMPRPVACLRLPTAGFAPLEQVETALIALDLDAGTPAGLRPFVHIALIPDRPMPTLMAEVEALLDRHPVRLASLRIDRSTAEQPEAPPASLADTTPEDLFRAAFRQTHSLDPDNSHLSAFRDALSEV